MVFVMVFVTVFATILATVFPPVAKIVTKASRMYADSEMNEFPRKFSKRLRNFVKIVSDCFLHFRKKK